jgi:hypothetical protein
VYCGMNDYISKPIIKRVIEDTLLSGQLVESQKFILIKKIIYLRLYKKKASKLKSYEVERTYKVTM